MRYWGPMGRPGKQRRQHMEPETEDVSSEFKEHGEVEEVMVVLVNELEDSDLFLEIYVSGYN